MPLGTPHQYGAASPSPLRWEHRQSADQTEWHKRYEPSVHQSDNSMFVPVGSRESSGSARLRGPYGVSLSRNRTEHIVEQWHAEEERLRKDDLEAQERDHVLYKLAHICTTMMRDNRGVVGDVPRAIGGSLVAPPIVPTHIQRHFGDLNGFGAVDELASIVTGSVSVSAVTTGAHLERALQYGNHRSVTEHLPAVWKKIGENVRRQKN